jgi:GNAT superfamily N-acetyltransferase
VAKIRVRPADRADVPELRLRYSEEANCQIVHYSFVDRGLADTYLIEREGRVVGYGALSNHYDKGRLVEFYVSPELRGEALPMFRELIATCGATHLEAQTNMPLMLLMLYDCGANIVPERIIFHDALTTNLECPPKVEFRRGAEGWLLQVCGAEVGNGGVLYHYNPPWGDIYMETVETCRRQGFGSYLVQELKRVCYEAGRKPAARCNLDNYASRRTLERAGMFPCGHILVGEVKPAK